MSTQRMPVLFAGHGSPMNAVEKTVFGDRLASLKERFPIPKSILIISAHWQTDGTQLVGSEQPKTIHDFYGFPEKLFSVRYAAPGNPQLAKRVQDLIPDAKIVKTWGFDHGTWSVLIHLYPEAKIPVLQMSIDEKLSLRDHFELAQKLKALRDEGVLIIGSGNIVHNLRAVKRIESDPNGTYDWSKSFDDRIKAALENRDIVQLTEYEKLWPTEAKLSVPSSEHYIPLIYAYGVTEASDELSFPIDGFQMASISMRTALWTASLSLSAKP